MAKYKVITLAMAVKNNRIAEFGETIDDAELTSNPSTLVKEGFIEVIQTETETIEVVEPKEVKPKGKK